MTGGRCAACTAAAGGPGWWGGNGEAGVAGKHGAARGLACCLLPETLQGPLSAGLFWVVPAACAASGCPSSVSFPFHVQGPVCRTMLPGAPQ